MKTQMLKSTSPLFGETSFVVISRAKKIVLDIFTTSEQDAAYHKADRLNAEVIKVRGPRPQPGERLPL